MKLNALILHNQDVIEDEEHFYKVNIWERDFVKNFLFSGHELSYRLVNIHDQSILDNQVDVIWFHCRIVPYSKVLSLCSTIKPKFIIMSGDEYWFEKLNHWNDLAFHCKLFFRHHHHPDFTYQDNVVHLPLGYTNGFYDQGDMYVPKIKARYYNWSHFGYPKTDRTEMVNHFASIERNWYAWNIDPYVVRETYLRSIFVPCGRGNASLECYRLYEATMSGALPVVAGPSEEIELTFAKQKNPPWIFAPNWEDAVELCKSLLEDKVKLQDMQDKNLAWWNDRMNGIKSQLQQFLED